MQIELILVGLHQVSANLGFVESQIRVWARISRLAEIQHSLFGVRGETLRSSGGRRNKPEPADSRPRLRGGPALEHNRLAGLEGFELVSVGELACAISGARVRAKLVRRRRSPMELDCVVGKPKTPRQGFN